MKFWPLSAAGSFLFLASLFLIGTAAPRGQGYGIFLGVFFLLYLAVSLIRIIILAFSFRGDLFQWRFIWNYAASEGKRRNLILAAPQKAPLGTRYLFICRGSLFCGKERLYSFMREIPFTEEAKDEVVLPLPGEARCSGRLFGTDFLGFVRYPLIPRENRTALYHPPLLADRNFPPPSSAERDEETIRNSPSQPEKILMRDYQPGDLVRDINWKASGKFTSIYTRIAPDLERSVTRMALIVRSEGTLGVEEPIAGALMLGLKSLAETIISTIRRDYPESQLLVLVGEESFLLEGEERGEGCLARISALERRGAASPEYLAEGGIVCTTASDRDIPLLREMYGTRLLI
ncbi:MAG: DUF58 domain-containing protein, partial [Spirochaetales bacterium]|nr:DUF58 domain-containing protein [Spirochaetales bacterium]